MSATYHIPVLLHTSIENLITNPDGIYVDVTFGGGGHSREILKNLSSKGKLFCFDQDPDAEKNYINEFSANEQVTFIPQNFRYMQKFLRVHGVTQVDGIFADLGVSSHQFDEGERGFSVRFDGPLDMRMNNNQSISAFDVINNYTEDQLRNMFSLYGEVRNSKQLAHIIINARTKMKQNGGRGITTTGELKNIALTVVKGEHSPYLSTVFQAVRIAVNDEMEALREMLESTAQLLKPGGRLVVISYHSLEDRMVKNLIKTGSVLGENEGDIMGRKIIPFKSLTKKPILPDEKEIKENPRSRSAKMRVAKRE